MKDQPKGLKEYLDYCVATYFYQTLEKEGFNKIDQKISGMGALYSFRSDGLILTIVNDRGVVETQIASIYSSYSWDFDLLNAFLNKQEQGKNIGKGISIKRLSLSEVSELMHLKMETIRKLFDKENYCQIEKALSEIAERRSEIMFGRRLK